MLKWSGKSNFLPNKSWQRLESELSDSSWVKTLILPFFNKLLGLFFIFLFSSSSNFRVSVFFYFRVFEFLACEVHGCQILLTQDPNLLLNLTNNEISWRSIVEIHTRSHSSVDLRWFSSEYFWKKRFYKVFDRNLFF